MISNIKIEKARDFKERPYNGDRSEWEDFRRYLRTEIQKNYKVPTVWKSFIFQEFPETPLGVGIAAPDPPTYVIPVEFCERVLPNLPAGNATHDVVRARNDNIRRDQAHNTEIGASISTITGIICECISAGLNKVYADKYLLEPYSFYRFLARTYGPAAAVNEDHNQCLFNLIKMKMSHLDTFDVFMIHFEQRCTYLQLNDQAKRGLLMTTSQATEDKIQMLPERLTKEFKSIRERDLNYSEAVDWLRKQDVIQTNNGLKNIKAIKPVKKAEQTEVKVTERADIRKSNVLDGAGNRLMPHMKCHNCHNYGHGAGRCNAEFCSSCNRANPNYKWSHCPKQSDGSA